jgi:hypothetical protein
MDEAEEPRKGRRYYRRRRRLKVTEGSHVTPPRLVGAVRWSLIIFASLIVIAGGLYLTHRLMVNAAGADDVAFDAEVWKLADRDGIYRNNLPKDSRLKMYRDLMDRDLIFGKTRAEVITLLGEPDNYPYFKRAWRDCNYWIGPQRGLITWGYLWLGVRFDKLGRVTEVRTLTDNDPLR